LVAGDDPFPARINSGIDQMKRRKFITLLGGAAVTWPYAERAQQPAMPVIGVLYGVSAAEWVDRLAGFRHGLSETGDIEGRNVTIEYRWAEGRNDRPPGLAADFGARPALLAATGGVRSAIGNVPNSGAPKSRGSVAPTPAIDYHGLVG
jgi:hypothetical protein